jgi:hypothetical protein
MGNDLQCRRLCGGDVAEYRALVVDAGGKVLKRFTFDVQHDTGAARYAQRYLEHDDIEVWQGARRVVVLKPVSALTCCAGTTER